MLKLVLQWTEFLFLNQEIQDSDLRLDTAEILP
jgi:hypothetical protein